MLINLVFFMHSVQDNYNTTGLSHLIQKIKNAAALPWRHTPIPKEVHGYITQVEYQKHLDTTPPNTTKNGIKVKSLCMYLKGLDTNLVYYYYFE